MRIAIIVDPTRRWRWHRHLAERLGSAGHRAVLLPAGQPRPLPQGLLLLMQLEALLLRRRQPDAAARQDEALPIGPPDGRFDVVLDTTGGASRLPAAERTLTLRYDGGDEDAAQAAALAGHPCRLTVVDPGRGIVASALAAIEDRRSTTAALDAIFGACPNVCLRAIEAPEPQAREPQTPDKDGRTETGGIGSVPVAFATVARLGRRIADRLTRLAGQGLRWQVGWHWLPEGAEGLLGGGALPMDSIWLDDDGRRFYADPFPLLRDGVIHLFCEEYPYATGKGVISHLSVGPRGVISPPRVVLERPCHLSYPFVFERDETVFMIPETGANRTIELYRADPFPDRWVLERVLVDNCAAADATLIEHGGRQYLFAALADGGSSWDRLGLFHAETFDGPWLAHPANPVLVDVRHARPAGRIEPGRLGLVRPAQDCFEGYGAGLSLCRIDRLDADDFRQTPLRLIGPPERWRARGLHTVNRAGRFQTIDRLAPPGAAG